MEPAPSTSPKLQAYACQVGWSRRPGRHAPERCWLTVSPAEKVALAPDKGVAAARIGDFALVRRDVDRRMGKVLEPSGMIEVMIWRTSRGSKPSALSCDRGLFGTRLDVVERDEERRQTVGRACDVARAEAGVDEDEARIGLD